MADILSQDEVDMLLSAVSDGEIEAAVEAAASEAAGPVITATYDFRRPERVSKEQLRGLQGLFEAFARELSQKLSSETAEPPIGWAQLRDWIDAIKEAREPLFPCESFRSQVELALALYKSAAINAPVQLPLQTKASLQ